MVEGSSGAVAGFQPGVRNPGKEAMVRKFLVFLALICVLGSVPVVGQLAGRVDLSFEMAPFPSVITTVTSLASVSPKGTGLGGPFGTPFLFLTVEYGIDSWTFGTLVTFTPYGLDSALFGARGALGPIQIVSYMDFYAGGFAYLDDGFGYLYGGDKLVLYDGAAKIPLFDPTFSEWWNLAWTSMAGLDLWAMGGVVNPIVFYDNHNGSDSAVGPLNDCCTPVTDGGFGLSLGLHGAAGGLEVWAEANFGAGHIVDELAYWDFSLAQIAGSWYQCHWGDIYGPCTIGFSDVVVYANSPFICGMLLARLEIDCDGFDDLQLLMRDLRFGIDWLYVDELGITFETDSKDVCLDFAVKAPQILCIQPYFSLVLDGQNAIEGLTLGALTMEYQWNGVTFVAVETLDCRYGITLDARLFDRDVDTGLCLESAEEPCSWNDPCLVPGDINEAFGLEFGSDACCGGGLSSGFYVFFDHEQDIESLFDWSAARAEIKVGIGANLESSLSGMFFAAGYQWYTFRVTFTWGTLRIFDYKPTPCDFWYAVAAAV